MLVRWHAAFEKDARWDQVVGFVERLGALARSLRRGFGVKFTNTLLVRNHMFTYEPSWSDAAVRRFIREVYLDNDVVTEIVEKDGW